MMAGTSPCFGGWCVSDFESGVCMLGWKINLSISIIFPIFANSKSNTLIIKILDMSKLLLLGDEAIAQAFIDAGGSAINSYPGTPSTQITE